MNGTSRVTLRWPALIAGALVLLATGAGMAYVAVRPAPPTVGNAAVSRCIGFEQRARRGGAASCDRECPVA